MIIKAFFDKNTATVSYIIVDESTNHCAILDSVLDYTPESGKTATTSADNLINHIKDNDLTLEWILETHLHADHLTAASYIQDTLGGKIAIGEHIKTALTYWTGIFNTTEDTPLDGSSFDYLLKDKEILHIGNLPVQVLHTPGHTPVCVSYLIEDAVFAGDVIFMPYVGTARADFPGADAKTLYHSIQKLFSLPDNTRIFTCHDYPLEGNAAAWESTVGEQKKNNILINNNISEEAYIQSRQQRDHNKPVPKLLLPAIQVNLRAGRLGKAEDNGLQYIKIPVNVL